MKTEMKNCGETEGETKSLRIKHGNVLEKASPKLFKLASRNNEQRQLTVACDTNNSFSIPKPFCVLIHSMIPMKTFFPARTTNNWLKC